MYNIHLQTELVCYIHGECIDMHAHHVYGFNSFMSRSINKISMTNNTTVMVEHSAGPDHMPGAVSVSQSRLNELHLFLLIMNVTNHAWSVKA